MGYELPGGPNDFAAISVWYVNVLADKSQEFIAELVVSLSGIYPFPPGGIIQRYIEQGYIIDHYLSSTPTPTPTLAYPYVWTTQGINYLLNNNCYGLLNQPQVDDFFTTHNELSSVEEGLNSGFSFPNKDNITELTNWYNNVIFPGNSHLYILQLIAALTGGDFNVLDFYLSNDYIVLGLPTPTPSPTSSLMLLF